VTDESVAQAAVQTAVAAFGRLDVLVNKAAYGDIAPFEQLSAERFSRADGSSQLSGIGKIGPRPRSADNGGSETYD
jgi:hypothetical protein